MATPKDLELYEQVKRLAEELYEKSSAYRSGFIIKEYKKRGGTFKDDHKPRNLKRWFLEKWTDVGHGAYPVYRPTRRISKKTPLTVFEIDERNLRKQIRLKQKIKGERNLPAFKKKKSSSARASRGKRRGSISKVSNARRG